MAVGVVVRYTLAGDAVTCLPRDLAAPSRRGRAAALKFRGRTEHQSRHCPGDPRPELVDLAAQATANRRSTTRSESATSAHCWSLTESDTSPSKLQLTLTMYHKLEPPCGRWDGVYPPMASMAGVGPMGVRLAGQCS
jgi:hypothetical protein